MAASLARVALLRAVKRNACSTDRISFRQKIPVKRRSHLRPLLLGTSALISLWMDATAAQAGTITYSNGQNQSTPVGLTPPGDTLDVTSGTATQSGDITETGSSSITKTGGGTLILNGNNSYSGGTDVAGGTLEVGTLNSLGSGSVTLSQSGTELLIGATGSVSNHLVINGGLDTTLSATHGQNVTFSGGFNFGTTATPIGTLHIGSAGNDGIIMLRGVFPTSYVSPLTLSVDEGTYRVGDSFMGGLTSFAGSNLNIGASGIYDLGGFDTTTAGLSGTGHITNNGIASTLILSGGTDSFGGIIQDGTGTTAVHLTNGEALTLTGANTYTGGTTVDSGSTLTGSTDSLQGNIADNGHVVFSGTGTTTVDYTGVISGTGDVTIANSVTIFDNAQTYNGGTFLTNSVLQLLSDNSLDPNARLSIDNGSTLNMVGTNQTIGSLLHNSGGDGAINIGGGSLTINQHFDEIYSGNIAGTGTLTMQGAWLHLTGGSSFSGNTFITSGAAIFVDNPATGLVNSPVTVNSTGSLRGFGYVGEITTNAGGTIAPGSYVGVQIGTLHDTGNATFNANSVYQVSVDASGQSDKIDAVGTATINGGNVQVAAASGQYAANTTYTILSATGGVTGVFDGATANYVFLTPTLSYDANNVYLNLASNGLGFASVATTPNQRAAATGAGSLGSGNDVFDTIQGLDAASARAAYDSLSGEIHASTGGALMNNAHYLSDAVFGRLRGTEPGTDNPNTRQLAAADGLQIETAAGPTTSRALWGEAFGGWAESDDNGNAAKLDNATAGFLVGLDGEVAPGWRLGLATGYSHSDIDLAARQSDAGVDSFHVAIYGGGHVGPISLRLGAAYSFNAVDSSRDVKVGGISDHDKASYDAHTAQIFGEVGYDAKIGKVSLEPFAGMSYVNLSTDGFTEHGGATALKSDSSNQDLPASTLGLRVGGEIGRVGAAKLSASGMLGWRHAYGDVTPDASFGFASGSDSFTIAGTPIARDALVAQASLALALLDNLAIGLSYDGQVASDARDHAVQGRVVWRF